MNTAIDNIIKYLHTCDGKVGICCIIEQGVVIAKTDPAGKTLLSFIEESMQRLYLSRVLSFFHAYSRYKGWDQYPSDDLLDHQLTQWWKVSTKIRVKYLEQCKLGVAPDLVEIFKRVDHETLDS